MTIWNWAGIAILLIFLAGVTWVAKRDPEIRDVVKFFLFLLVGAAIGAAVVLGIALAIGRLP
jgi:hypothetical protein